MYDLRNQEGARGEHTHATSVGPFWKESICSSRGIQVVYALFHDTIPDSKVKRFASQSCNVPIAALGRGARAAAACSRCELDSTLFVSSLYSW
jgi:hypothetical protein